MKVLDIGEVARQSGVPPSALRYYEEIGLVRPVARHGLRRQYDADVLQQLALISLGKVAGFTLTEIAGMFGEDGAPDLPRATLHERADALDRKIKNLTTLRNALRHVADCPAESHMECAKFRRLMRMAAHSTAAAGEAARSAPHART
ncbi:MAG: helix-turn-helix domain-containing protein [Rhodospirillaceae bacterium]|nr:helix-turn-helix domain-containing protein [Rhodospirillaceae bacterium]MCA8931020.1 helix-turn-helix domain-containing protein [Rhodospirillaceae bacterium]